MPVNMDSINAVAKKYGLFVVEDCALAIGSWYKGIHAGVHGDVGCFSFYPVKHMTTAEGGMLTTQKEEIAARITRQKAFGVDRTAGERTIPGVYDVTMLGYNYRMNEIEAAIGTEQLRKIDWFLEKRKENYEHLQKGLKEISEIDLFLSSHGEFQSSYYCLSIIIKDFLAPSRFDIVENLKRNGVGTSVYYPKPVPHLQYYRSKYQYGETDFPVAARISRNSIALPVGPHLDIEDMEYVVECVKSAIMEVRKNG
jgi:dTDP-4-amino-4,6-dideoxygalactose transaminase